jgi:hypothetical protein
MAELFSDLRKSKTVSFTAQEKDISEINSLIEESGKKYKEDSFLKTRHYSDSTSLLSSSSDGNNSDPDANSYFKSHFVSLNK